MFSPHQKQLRASLQNDLVNRSTNDEIHHLRPRIIAIGNRCDIFTKLPLELSLQIAQHLEIFQVFQARRVSKSWCRILSSPEFLNTFYLRPWFGQIETTSQKPEGLSVCPTISSRAEQIDAFHYGRARMASGTCCFLQRAPTPHLGGSTYYAGGIFARTRPGLRSFHLRCLRTGTAVELFIPNDERVGLFAMSTSAVAVITTDGKGYVWEISSGLSTSPCLNAASPLFLGIPSVTMDLLTVSNSSLVKVSRGATGYQVATWDLILGEGYTFIVQGQSSRQTPRGSIKLINTGQEKTMVFFERILDDEGFVHFTRFTLNGEAIFQGTLMHPDVSDYRQSDHSLPCNVHGSITIWSYTRQDENKLHVLSVCYNARKDRLELKEKLMDNTIKASHGLGVDLFWWQNVAYVVAHGTQDANALRHVRIVDLQTDVCRKVEKGWKITRTERSTSTFLGDATFLISVGHSGYYIVWCFDKSSPLANEMDMAL